MMRSSLKIIIFVIVLAILGILVVLGYNTYLSQKAQVPKLPYTTTVAPEPTQLPTQEGISGSDRTADLEKDLNATTLSDLESDLSSLEKETEGL